MRSNGLGNATTLTLVAFAGCGALDTGSPTAVMTQTSDEVRSWESARLFNNDHERGALEACLLANERDGDPTLTLKIARMSDAEPGSGAIKGTGPGEATVVLAKDIYLGTDFDQAHLEELLFAGGSAKGKLVYSQGYYDSLAMGLPVLETDAKTISLKYEFTGAVVPQIYLDFVDDVTARPVGYRPGSCTPQLWARDTQLTCNNVRYRPGFNEIEIRGSHASPGSAPVFRGVPRWASIRIRLWASEISPNALRTVEQTLINLGKTILDLRGDPEPTDRGGWVRKNLFEQLCPPPARRAQ